MEFPALRVLVFAKAPRPGRVKTRLAPRLGARGAAWLYRRLLRGVLARAARLAPLELWGAPDARHPALRACVRDFGARPRRQAGADLGRRMDLALRCALADAAGAVVIGADCVSLTHDDLRAALAALAGGRDAVLVPAEDGGYVLLGLRRPCTALFRGVAWGSARVAAQTRRRLRRAGLDWVELPPGWDLDRPADLRRYRRLAARAEAHDAAGASPKASVV